MTRRTASPGGSLFQVSMNREKTMNRDREKKRDDPDYSRREFIKAGALTVGAAAAISMSGHATAQAAVKANGFPLSMDGYNFDRTRALIDGSVNTLVDALSLIPPTTSQ